MMSHDHMRQTSTPLWWSLSITQKFMTLGFNWEGTKHRYTYQWELKVKVDYAAPNQKFNTSFDLPSVRIRKNTFYDKIRYILQFSNCWSSSTENDVYKF